MLTPTTDQLATDSETAFWPGCVQTVPASCRFCRRCGDSLSTPAAPLSVIEPLPVTVTLNPAADLDPVVGDSAHPILGRVRRAAWVRWSCLGLVATAMLVAAGLGIKNDVDTHRTLSTTQDSLAATQGTLKSTQADLISTKGTLTSTQADLSSTRNSLSS